MASQIFTRIKKFLPFIGIILFLYLLYTLNVGKIVAAIQSIPPWYILVAALLTIPVILLRNLIWMMIHKQQHIQIKFFPSLKIFLIGYFYGTISPGYLGQLMRIPYMKEKTKEPYGKLFVNTFLETSLHTFSLYIMMVIGGVFFLRSQPTIVILVFAWIVILGILFLFFIKKERGERVFLFLIKYLIPKQAKPSMTQFVNTFYTDFPKIRMLLIPCFLGAITWVITFTQQYLIVLALGVSIPYLGFLFLFPIANTAGFIPITFAGLGTREFTAIVLFSSLYMVSQEQIFVISLVGFLITDALTGFYGFILSLTETKKKSFSYN